MSTIGKGMKVGETIAFNKDIITYRLLARGCLTHKQYRGKAAPSGHCNTCHMIRKLALEVNLWWQDVEVVPLG